MGGQKTGRGAWAHHGHCRCSAAAAAAASMSSRTSHCALRTHPPPPRPHRSAMTWQANAAELYPGIAQRSWGFPATLEEYSTAPAGCLLHDVVNANAAFKTCVWRRRDGGWRRCHAACACAAVKEAGRRGGGEAPWAWGAWLPACCAPELPPPRRAPHPCSLFEQQPADPAGYTHGETTAPHRPPRLAIHLRHPAAAQLAGGDNGAPPAAAAVRGAGRQRRRNSCLLQQGRQYPTFVELEAEHLSPQLRAL